MAGAPGAQAQAMLTSGAEALRPVERLAHGWNSRRTLRGPTHSEWRRRGNLSTKISLGLGGTMSDQQKVNALLVKLEHGQNFSSLEVSDTINELLSLSAPVDKIANIVERRVDEDVVVLSETLATLLAKSHSQALYKKVANRIKSDLWALLILYKGQFPDVQIEKALIKTLYEVAADDAEPRRQYIVEAMKEVGSEAVLPVLEAIAHDLEPGAKVGKAFGNALGLVESLAAKSRYAFLEVVLVAIDEIKKRSMLVSTSVDRTAAVDEVKVGFDEASNVSQFKSDAEKYLGLAPGLVIHYVRKGAEALAKDLYRHLGLEKGGRPAKRMMLDDLITAIKQVKKNPAPDLLQVFLLTFQGFGNFASHDQDGEEKYITNEIAEAVYLLYCEALKLYVRWQQQAQREPGNIE